MKTETERESREWWAITDTKAVMRVTGFSCAPNNPEMWWVPSLGYSMSEKYHLFKTEAAAVDKVIEELERLSTETEERLIAFRMRRKSL